MQTTAYAITRSLDASFDEAIERVTAALAAEGFGIVSKIDVQATMKKKLGVVIAPHVILGACNPELARRGLALEPDLGVLLPCNVVVRQNGDQTAIAAMEPVAAMAIASNPALKPLALEARERIERAVSSL